MLHQFTHSLTANINTAA
ncbi:hypothetical protein E2C01_096669 [Portunus trituberculatus]|uniref:Uncharacterized protein n=1 Tax=Portunus trituberculatus TaxID=210409 RepID=A0A5B7JYH7_PORTR|nr:hypothetical protein [Portunus trituberculatus]